MSDEVLPQRLDELLGGELPETDAEREIVELAARIEADVPGPSESLRERVQSISAGAGRAPGRRWFPRPQLAAVLGATLVALIGATVLVTQDSSDSTVAADAMSTQPVTPGSQRSSELAVTPDALQSADSPSASGDTSLYGRSYTVWDIPNDEMAALVDELSAIAETYEGSIEVGESGRAVAGAPQGFVVMIAAPPANRAQVRSEVTAAVVDARSALPGHESSGPASAAPSGGGTTPEAPPWPLTLVLIPVP